MKRSRMFIALLLILSLAVTVFAGYERVTKPVTVGVSTTLDTGRSRAFKLTLTNPTTANLLYDVWTTTATGSDIAFGKILVGTYLVPTMEDKTITMSVYYIYDFNVSISSTLSNGLTFDGGLDHPVTLEYDD